MSQELASVYGAELVDGKLKIHAMSSITFAPITQRLSYQNRRVIDSNFQGGVRENHHYTASFTMDELQGVGEMHPDKDNPMHMSEPSEKIPQLNIHYVPLLLVQEVFVKPSVVTETRISRFWAVVEQQEVLEANTAYTIKILLEIWENGKVVKSCYLENLDRVIKTSTIVDLSYLADNVDLRSLKENISRWLIDMFIHYAVNLNPQQPNIIAAVAVYAVIAYLLYNFNQYTALLAIVSIAMYDFGDYLRKKQIIGIPAQPLPVALQHSQQHMYQQKAPQQVPQQQVNMAAAATCSVPVSAPVLQSPSLSSNSLSISNDEFDIAEYSSHK